MQCPACATFFTGNLLSEIEQRFGERVVVIARHFPLLSIHDHSFFAACAVEAAALQGKYVEMLLKVLSDQKRWVRTNRPRSPDMTGMFSAKPIFSLSVRREFVRMAGDLGLDKRTFRSDLSSEYVRQRVFADLERARSLSLGSTPTVFLDGGQVDFALFSALPDLIEKKLKK